MEKGNFEYSQKGTDAGDEKRRTKKKRKGGKGGNLAPGVKDKTSCVAERGVRWRAVECCSPSRVESSRVRKVREWEEKRERGQHTMDGCGWI